MFSVKIKCSRNVLFWGFPGGTVVESLPANAGDTGSSPGLGGSHMPRNDWAREPQLLSLRVWSLCSATRETTIVRGPRTAMKSGPRLPQLEKALAQKRRPNTAKKKKKRYQLKKKKKCIILMILSFKHIFLLANKIGSKHYRVRGLLTISGYIKSDI